MTTQINVYKSDKLYDLNFTLKDANDAAIDITGCTILFKAQKSGAAANKFSGTGAIVSGPAGTCKYTVQATDFDEAGDYYAEVEVTFVGGKILTFGDILVRVKPELPR